MPKETFYDSNRIQDDGKPPDLVVTWGIDQPEVKINDIRYDRSGLNRLIKSLKKARDQTYGADE